MNEFESLPAGDGAPPQLPPAGERRFLLESIFLGPQGVRAGWRAAFYAALLFLVLSAAARTKKERRERRKTRRASLRVLPAAREKSIPARTGAHRLEEVAAERRRRREGIQIRSWHSGLMA